MRSSNLPEELGGIEYLLTDKTGTLTRNEMRFRKFHLGFACFSDVSVSELRDTVATVLAARPISSFGPATNVAVAFAEEHRSLPPTAAALAAAEIGRAIEDGGRGVGITMHTPSLASSSSHPHRDRSVPEGRHSANRREGSWVLACGGGDAVQCNSEQSCFAPVSAGAQCTPPIAADVDHSQHTAVVQALLAIALCHNVSPIFDPSTSASPAGMGCADASSATATRSRAPRTPLSGQHRAGRSRAAAEASSGKPYDGSGCFQGASPDELALVQFAARCGLVLAGRTLTSIVLREPSGQLRAYDLLHEMPFTSESKRMGVILRHVLSGEIVFYVKGADTVMLDRVSETDSDWVEEETGNLAREGLRTLVVACRSLSQEVYERFASELHKARLARTARSAAVNAAFGMLEEDLRVLCVTAVEDRLQAHVRTTLEMLRGANVRIWMLTGDKLETAVAVAQTASLVARHQSFYAVRAESSTEARQQLHGYPQGSINAPCLILNGASLDVCVENHTSLFIEVACAAPTVVVCRCSPTQKAAIVHLLRKYTHKCTAAIGDGGNDVGMIHAAHVGIGVEGREGRQAALAADFSISQFSHVARLVLWHGRNCYLRSATLAQFVIHRGLIISFIQLVFSALFYFRPIPLYNGTLVLGCARTSTTISAWTQAARCFSSAAGCKRPTSSPAVAVGIVALLASVTHCLRLSRSSLARRYATLFTAGPVFSLVLDEDVSENNGVPWPRWSTLCMSRGSVSAAPRLHCEHLRMQRHAHVLGDCGWLNTRRLVGCMQH